jgi:uncharacterized protein
MAIEVVDNPEQHRYEVTRDGAPAGFTAYRRQPGQILFVHTEVDERFEGRGLGSRLIHDALKDARKQKLAVVPLCPFVRSFIQRHPEYVDLVPEQRRDEFGLAGPQAD